MFLVMLPLADWAFVSAPAGQPAHAAQTSRLRTYLPYAAVSTLYLVIDLPINSRSYLVSEGHYGFGIHIVTHALDYIAALYVGRQDAANYLLSAIAVGILLWRGSRRVVFATCWMLIALAPFVFFTWGNASRYLYLPAMGFSMLVADGVLQIHRMLASRLSPTAANAATTLVAVAMMARFVVFDFQNLEGFIEQTESYRRYIGEFKQAHATLAPHSRVVIDARAAEEHSVRFLTALVQWEYHDPTIELVADP